MTESKRDHKSGHKRWYYRLESLRKAYSQFQNALELAQARELSALEKQGLIQGFEFTHELAWKTLRDFLIDRGATDLFGSKDTTRLAFQKGLITDGEAWMRMIEHRNLSSHTYQESTADEIVLKSKLSYGPLFKSLLRRLEELQHSEEQTT